MAYGGNFYALTPAADAGLSVDPARSGELIEAGLAVMEAINATERPEHPADPRIGGCRHVVFHEPGRDGADAVAATSIHPGWLDRSPCGTGTSARMAQLHARGELALGDAVRQRVRDRHPLHRPARRGDDRSPASPPSSRRSPAAPGSPAWASTCSTPRTRSRPVSLCKGSDPFRCSPRTPVAVRNANLKGLTLAARLGHGPDPADESVEAELEAAVLRPRSVVSGPAIATMCGKRSGGSDSK